MSYFQLILIFIRSLFKFLFHSRLADPLIEPKISRVTLQTGPSHGPPPLPVNNRPMSWIPQPPGPPPPPPSAPPPPGTPPFPVNLRPMSWIQSKKPPSPSSIARSSLKHLMSSYYQNIFDNDIYKQMSEHYELKKEGEINYVFI